MDSTNLDQLIARAWQERMTRRRFLRLSGMGMGAVALGPILAACGQRGGPGGPATAAPTIAELALPTGDITLEFWNPFTGPDGPFMARLVDQFNTENPTVTVNVTTQAEYYTQVNNAAQSDSLPHVLIMHLDAIPRNAADGIISPVNDLVDLLQLSGEDFTEAVWNGTEWKGERYGIPLDIHTFTFYANRSLLAEAGLPEELPADRESFENALQALNDAGVTGPVWSNHGFSSGLLWASLFYQGGGQWIAEDYSEVTYNQEPGVQAAQWIRDQIDAGRHPESVEVDAEIASFAEGDSGMAMAGIWQTTRFAEALGEDLIAGPIPQVFDEPGVWAGSHTLAVAAGVDGAERQAAYYFINWINERAYIWAEGGQLPARRSAREAPEFAELEYIPQIAEQIESARFFPNFPGSGDLLFGAGGANEAVLRVIAEDADPQAALDESADTMHGVLQDAVEEHDLGGGT